MEKEKVLAILAGYGINDYSEAQEISYHLLKNVVFTKGMKNT
ncbi:hypothetical protein [Butyrivibrio sp. YAB3001]|nr:hypothetical protein [Butyrivibrio sp. YAB3001]